jgi:hypothetical protein
VSEGTPTQVPGNQRWPWLSRGRLAVIGMAVVLAAALAVIAGVVLRDPYPGLGALQRDDPDGAAACQLLGEWLDGQHVDENGEPENPLIVASAVAAHAADSTTPAIRFAAGPSLGESTDEDIDPLLQINPDLAEFRIGNLEALHSACTSAGVRLPALDTG